MSLRRVVSSLTAAVCLLAAGLSVGVDPAVAVPTTTAVFNNPVGTAAEKAAIQTRVVELIDGALAGSRIRMAMFYATDATVPNALIAAKNRGVNVQVVFNDADPATAPYASLVAALGTSLSASSWILLCPAGRGCIGNRVLGSLAVCC